MSLRTRNSIKTRFVTGATPSQQDFYDWVESLQGTTLMQGQITAGDNATFLHIDFSAFIGGEGYTELMINLQSVILETNSADFGMQYSTDGSAGGLLTGAFYSYIYPFGYTGGTNVQAETAYPTVTNANLCKAVDVGTGKFIKGKIYIDDPGNANIMPSTEGIMSFWKAAVGRVTTRFSNHYEAGTGPVVNTVKGVRFFPSAGKIISCKWSLKGS